jgi:predicted ferric reductase
VSLAVRTLSFSVIYVALTLIPVAVALAADPFTRPRPWLVDASAAIAFIAFPLLLMQFALVSRFGPASRVLGSDALMSVHRQVAVVALMFVVVHAFASSRVDLTMWSPFSGSSATRWGAVALWSLVAIVVTSFGRRRFNLSYEAWRLIHLTGALLLAWAMIAHMFAVAGYSATTAVRTTLLLYAALFLVLLLRYRLVRPALLARRPWVVMANQDVGGRSRLIRLRADGHDGVRFEPGQFAWLVTGRSPLFSQQHPLSIASGAEAGSNREIEFLIKGLGDWSGTAVPALAPGDRVWVDGPFGAFTPARLDADGFVLIAGGIGIAPLRSMLLTMAARHDPRPVVLFYAAADRPRAVLADALEALRAQVALTIVFVFDEPDDRWTGERGRLTADVIRRHLPPEHLRFQYFVCGPLPMIDLTESLLETIGIPASRVHTERFQVV